MAKNGTTWYFKNDLTTIKPQSYDPGLHIFLKPCQEVFLLDNLVESQGSAHAESKEEVTMIYALHKDEQGRTREVGISNKITRNKNSGAANVFFDLYTPGYKVRSLTWEHIKANFTITSETPTVAVKTSAQILYYPLPYNSGKETNGSYIRLTSSQQEPFKIEYFYRKNGVGSLTRAFSFFQDNRPPNVWQLEEEEKEKQRGLLGMTTQDNRSPNVWQLEEEEEEQRGLLDTTTTYLSKVWKAFTR